jgi:hypothetical protein
VLIFSKPFKVDFKIPYSKIDLASLYSFISQTEVSYQPSLTIHGEAETNLHINTTNETLSLSGHIKIRDGLIEKKDKNIIINGIEAYLPIYYEKGLKKKDEQEKEFLEKGYFSIKEFKSSYFSKSLIRINIQARKNKFLIYPVSFDIFGGTIETGNFLINISSTFNESNGATHLLIKNLDISKFPIKSTQIHLAGSLSGILSPVTINSQKITTEGQIIIHIFDGKIIVKNINVLAPFSKGRIISCDVTFEDINLEKVTNSIPFGRVTGIIKGEIRDLAFSYGQPERFVMNIESVKRKGVPQKFSVRAVNDISLISSGEEVPISSQKGFYQFIPEYAYEKIGIFCSLKNDIFTLRGNIKENGKEYLVKKSWLFGINVINKNPNNRISFKEMINRLKRIGRTKKQ